MKSNKFILASILLIVGFGFIFNPYYLWPHHGDNDFEVTAHRTDEPPDEAIPLSELPSATKDFVNRVITRSSNGESVRVESRESFPSQGLSWGDTQPIVSKDGQSYRLDIDRLERTPPVLPEHWLIRVGLGFGGSILLALGGLTGYHGRPRITPRSGWTVVIVWTTVIIGTVLYDGNPSGLGITDAFPMPGTALVGSIVLILPAIGVVAGAKVRSRDWEDPRTTEPAMILAFGFIAVTFLISLPGAVIGWLLGTPPTPTEQQVFGNA